MFYYVGVISFRCYRVIDNSDNNSSVVVRNRI